MFFLIFWLMMNGQCENNSDLKYLHTKIEVNGLYNSNEFFWYLDSVIHVLWQNFVEYEHYCTIKQWI